MEQPHTVISAGHRPIYGTAKDQSAIDKVISYVCYRYGVHAKPRGNRFDPHTHILYTDAAHEHKLAIVKCMVRKRPRSAYGYYRIAEKKIKRLLDAARLHGVKAQLVINWGDGAIGFLCVSDTDYVVEQGTRHVRKYGNHDPKDDEVFACYQYDQFKKIIVVDKGLLK